MCWARKRNQTDFTGLHYLHAYGASAIAVDRYRYRYRYRYTYLSRGSPPCTRRHPSGGGATSRNARTRKTIKTHLDFVEECGSTPFRLRRCLQPGIIPVPTVHNGRISTGMSLVPSDCTSPRETMIANQHGHSVVTTPPTHPTCDANSTFSVWDTTLLSFDVGSPEARYSDLSLNSEAHSFPP